MRVYVTVDMEFYPGDRPDDEQGTVWRGLGIILDCARRHGIGLTFFLEALGATRWGCGHLTRLGTLLRDQGHDVQLHLHPVAALLDGFDSRLDTMWRHDAGTQAMMMRMGLDQFARAGLDVPTVFRAGNLAANEDTLAAMRVTGLRIGSNRDLDEKSSIESKLNGYFPVLNDVSEREGVVDVPVSALRSRLPWLDGRFRHLQVCALGSRELRGALLGMHKNGFASACILTHPGEFAGGRRGTAVADAINIRRLDALFGFLAGWRGGTVDRIANCAGTLVGGRPALPELWFNPVWSLLRVAEQARKRLGRPR